MQRKDNAKPPTKRPRARAAVTKESKPDDARTQQALQNSEMRFRALIENSTDAISLLSADGTMLYRSPSSSRITGYSDDELIGKDAFDLIHPEDVPLVTRLFAQILQPPNASASSQFRYRHKDGSWIWLEGIGTNLLDDPNVGAIVANFRDITARVRAERRFSAQHAVTRALAESAALNEAVPGILHAICENVEWERAELWSGVWSVDRQANVLRCVEAWQRPPDTFPQFDAATRNALFAPGEGLPGRVWATGEPVWIPDVTQDPNFVCAPIAAQKGVHAAFAFPIRLGREILGVIAFFCRDIRPQDDDQLQLFENISNQIGQFIGRKQAEDAVRQSEERYRMLIEQAADGIFVSDSNGRYIDVNPSGCAMLGYTREEILNLSVTDLIPAQDLAARPVRFDELRVGKVIVNELVG